MTQRSPSPADEATPFLLRVYVKPAPFRPLDDFHSSARLSRDEFKLHLWKTNTLREVAQMLYDADPSISTPLALHAFRRISWNDRSREYQATSAGVGVTRVPLDAITALLSDVMELDTGNDSSQAAGNDADNDAAANAESPVEARAKSNPNSNAALLGFDMLRDEIDDTAAAITLAQLDLADGDFLDCVVKPDPSLALAPKQSRATDRDRRHSADRQRPYRY